MKQTKDNFNAFTLEISQITKHYDTIKAVDDISFNTKSGEIIALLGPNGAGKSTLMNMISGFLAPTSGEILVNGNNVATNDLITKKDVGFLPEGAPMYADMSVKLFLNYMVELKLNLIETEELKKAQIKKIYAEEFDRIIKTAKIEDILSQKIETLSKGYLRRVGFAQSIIGNPPIMLLDEPTDGLDPNQKEHIRDLIKDMGRNKTVIISTHLLDEAESIASRIILINKGKILVDGTLKSILDFAKCKTLDEAFKKLTTAEEN